MPRHAYRNPNSHLSLLHNSLSCVSHNEFPHSLSLLSLSVLRLTFSQWHSRRFFSHLQLRPSPLNSDAPQLPFSAATATATLRHPPSLSGLATGTLQRRLRSPLATPFPTAVSLSLSLTQLFVYRLSLSLNPVILSLCKQSKCNFFFLSFEFRVFIFTN